jgi:hypothetical protein
LRLLGGDGKGLRVEVIRRVLGEGFRKDLGKQLQLIVKMPDQRAEVG